jgi:hypothetical protein
VIEQNNQSLWYNSSILTFRLYCLWPEWEIFQMLRIRVFFRNAVSQSRFYCTKICIESLRHAVAAANQQDVFLSIQKGRIFRVAVV